MSVSTTQSYTTSNGDMLDAIAYAQYGTTDGGVVEQILAANPGLAIQGPVYPNGVIITLPVINTTAQVQGVRLWD